MIFSTNIIVLDARLSMLAPDPTSKIIKASKSTCSQQRQRNRFLGTSVVHLTIISENMHHKISCNLGETQNLTSQTLTTIEPPSINPKCCQIFIITWKGPPHGLSISPLMNMLINHIKMQSEGFKRKEVCEETNLVQKRRKKIMTKLPK